MTPSVGIAPNETGTHTNGENQPPAGNLSHIPPDCSGVVPPGERLTETLGRGAAPPPPEPSGGGRKVATCVVAAVRAVELATER